MPTGLEGLLHKTDMHHSCLWVLKLRYVRAVACYEPNVLELRTYVDAAALMIGGIKECTMYA